MLIRLHDSREEIERLQQQLLDAVERAGFSKSSRFAIRLALEEAIINAFTHGHAELPNEPVLVEYRVDQQRVEIAIEDKGPGFDPGDVPDPTLDENLDKPSGRGLMLIRAYMSRVSFNPTGNRLEMAYERPISG